MRPKDYEVERLRNQFNWYFQFIVANWPADPFSGQWVEVEHLPDEIVGICQQAQGRLASFPCIPGFACFRRSRGEIVEARVESGWLDGYLRSCAIVEPDAHEKPN